MNYIFRLTGFVVFLIVAATLTGCKGETMKDDHTVYSNINEIPAAAWEKLSQKKIYFGHQSVGFNIIEGINALMKEYSQIKLNIVETNKLSDATKGVFAHSRVGKNRDPKSKNDEFSQVVNTIFKQYPDVAMLKYCYVDIIDKTDVSKIFDEYSTTMAEIKQKHSKLNIIHFTVPLTTTRTTWKTKLKIILGKKEIGEYDSNIKRNEYNMMLANKYSGIEPIFDLAKIESTFPDGSRCTFQKNEKSYFSLVPEYSDDGGHLNDTGRKKVAEQLLLLLVNL